MIRKKINKKGFTLIELLAVIVILAVVMVVTIPSVLTSMNSAKKTQFENALEGVAQWLTKQYDLASLNLETSSAYNAFVTAYYEVGQYNGTNPYTYAPGINYAVGDSRNFSKHKQESVEMLKAAGISDPENDIDLDNTYFYIDGNRIEVVGTPKENGQFYINDYSNLGNIFDIRTIISIYSPQGNRLAINEDGYWKISFSALTTRYTNQNNATKPRCGFLANNSIDFSSVCPYFVGTKYAFKEKTSYKVTFEGKREAGKTCVPRIRAWYVESNYQSSEFCNLGTTQAEGNSCNVTNDTYTFITDSSQTVKYFYFAYNTNKDCDLYIKDIVIEEIG